MYNYRRYTRKSATLNGKKERMVFMNKLKKVLCCIQAVILVIIAIHSISPSLKTASAYEEDKTDSLMLVPEVNSSMSFDKEILQRLDGPEDPKNFISYRASDGEIIGLLYPVDVKYTDSKGNLRDKSNIIYKCEEREYSYETRDNDIITLFPKNISKGTKTSYKDYEVNVTPVYQKDSSPIFKDKKVVYYDIFGKGTSIEYCATFNGVKDVIIIENAEMIGNYQYIVTLSGLNINEEGYLTTNEKVVGTFGSVIIEDSAGKIFEGNLVFEPASESSSYLMTVELPMDTVNWNEDVVYPLYIDPGVHFYTGSDYYGNAFFTTSNAKSNYTSTGGSFTQDSILRLGTLGVDSIYRNLIKFPGLQDVIQNIIPCCSTANLSLFRYQSYSGTEAVYVEAYPEKYAWKTGINYTPLKYSNCYSKYYNETYTIGNHLYTSYGRSKINVGAAANLANTIPIQNVIRYSNFSLSKGILLKLSDETKSVSFYGSNTPYSAYMPRISFSYNDSEAEAIVSGGIYRLSPCTDLTTASNYACNSSLTLSVKSDVVASVSGYPSATYPDISYSSGYYPSGFTAYKSFLRSFSQLFKITYTGYGYTIQRLSDNFYLKCVNSSSLTFVSEDDTNDFTTRWFLLENNGNYLIVHYFYNYLSVNGFSSNSCMIISNYNNGEGVHWSLELYCLNVPYIHQVDHTTCGAVGSLMLLNWLGIDTSSYSETGFKSYALSLYNPGYITAESYCFAIFKSIYNETGVKQYGTSLSPLLCSDNTAYTYIRHKDNPLTINTGNEGNPAYDYSQVETSDEYFRIIKANIDSGYPVMIHIGGFTSNSYFNYSLSGGHFILAIGAYTNSAGVKHIVCADPHYKSVSTGSSQSYAFLDIPFDSYYNSYQWSGATIRNVLWG